MPCVRVIRVLFLLPVCTVLAEQTTANPSTPAPLHFGNKQGSEKAGKPVEEKARAGVPITPLVTVGDRPTVCLERAAEYLSPNLEIMTQIAVSLAAERSVDEVGLVRSPDGTGTLAMSLDRRPVRPSKLLRSAFRPQFDRLRPNWLTPWVFFQYGSHVLAQPGDYVPTQFVSGSAPVCGSPATGQPGTQALKKISEGALHGGPVLYRWHADGRQLEKPCTDENFLTEARGRCELPLAGNWAVIFTWINKPVGSEAGE